MANWYVYHAAVGSGTGADWTNAYTTLGAAMGAKAAGDTFFVAHDHAETATATKTIASTGTEILTCLVFCVNRAGSVPPVAADLRTTATITTSSGASNINMTGSCAECYGITFRAGSSTTAASITVGGTASRSWRLVNCNLELLNTSTSSRINLGVGSGYTVLENCTVKFSNANQRVAPVGRVRWTGGSIVLGTTPGGLIAGSTAGAQVLIEACDLTNSGTYCADTTLSTNVVLKDCKTSSSGNCSSFIGSGTLNVMRARADNADTSYRCEYQNASGWQRPETTIVRSGGATDGTTPLAWRIDTTFASSRAVVFECPPIMVWNETTGSSKTITIEGIWGGGAVPTNADIWINVWYLGTSGNPMVSKATTGRATLLDAATNCSSGSGTWGGSTTQFSMSVTVTPQEKGPFTIYVNAMTASTTFYIDPKPVIT